MSIRRIVVWMWCCVLLFCAIPKLYNGSFELSNYNAKATATQIDTPVGTFHVKRFPFDFIVFAYLDGYNSLYEITYVDAIVGLPSLRHLKEIESPMGLCIVANKMLRGKYIPREVEELYSLQFGADEFGISMDSLRIASKDELTALCEYYKLNTVTTTEVASGELLTATLEEDSSAIVLMHGYYPLLVYQKVESGFYAYDPVNRTDKAFIEYSSDGRLIFRAGLLTYAGGEVVKCLDTLA